MFFSATFLLLAKLKMSAMDTSMAFKTWEMSNSIETVNSVDEIFKYDRQQQQEILQAKPWQKELVRHSTIGSNTNYMPASLICFYLHRTAC